MSWVDRRTGVVRTVLMALLATFVTGCDGILVAAPESNLNVADFESTWSWVDSVYPAFEAKQIDWDHVYSTFRPAAEVAAGDEIFVVLHDMLAALQDAHLYYQTNGGGLVYPHFPSRWKRDRHTFDPELVRSYVGRELLLAGDRSLEYERLDGDLGYIRISTFSRDELTDDIGAVMRFMRDTEGLIIDVRNNNGGDHDKVAAVVGPFIGEPFPWMMGVEQDGVPFEPWPAIEPTHTGETYTRPTVVLANGASISGAELFSEVMKQIPSVTLVGDTTAGAACNDRDVTNGDLRLPSGKLIHIPTGCILRYDGVLMEWNGVVPDIVIAQTETDIRVGRDRQLEAAIEMLR